MLTCDATCLGANSDALEWAKLAGVKMTEGQVIHIVVIGLSVMLGKEQTGVAEGGINPVELVFESVEAAARAKFLRQR